MRVLVVHAEDSPTRGRAGLRAPVLVRSGLLGRGRRARTTPPTAGPPHCSAERLAHGLTEALADRGLEVHLYPASSVRNAVGFDAVVVTGALDEQGWHREARRFVARTRRELRRVPVWLAACAPAEAPGSTSSRAAGLAALPQLQAATARVRARGHRMFTALRELELPEADVLTVADAAVTADDVQAWAQEISESLAAAAVGDAPPSVAT